MDTHQDPGERLCRLFEALALAYMAGDVSAMDDLWRQIEEALAMGD